MINRILATPKVRKFARELGADISNLYFHCHYPMTTELLTEGLLWV